MNTRFTEHVKSVLTRAYTFAIQTNSASLQPIHLLAALASERGSVASDLIKKAGLEAKIIREYFISGDAPEDEILLDFSDEVKELIEQAAKTASKYKHSFIGTEHILFALINTNDEDIKKLFSDKEVNKEEIGQTLKIVFEADSANLKNQKLDLDEMLKDIDRQEENKEQEEKALDYFARELTDKETSDDIDYIVGRDEEIERIVTILNRRQKNNPVLLGHPGVGKTAIIEHIAKLIAQNKAPKNLLGKKIYEVDLAGMIAGTVYRGEFEERIKQLIEEAEADENVILFIDELHTIIGAGANSGTLDAANILKPALARGKLRCIGATTNREYKKYIADDQAFARRFQEVPVREPSMIETVEMLQLSKKYFERFHEVKFPKSVIEYLVQMADDNLANRYFPDKAVDLMDEVAARLKMTKPDIKKINLSDAEQALNIIFNQSTSNYSIEDLQEILSYKIKHQEDALNSFIKYFYKNKIKEKNQISFIVSGPKKSGKSHFVSEIANTFFEKSKQLHIKAEDYKEKHSISSLLGTSAGYIGYKDSAKLIDFLQNEPNGVVVIHEVEKASNEFRKIVRSLNEGKITAGDGNVVKTNKISIICSSIKTAEKEIGFSANEITTDNDTSLSELFDHAIELEVINNEKVKMETRELINKKIKSLKKHLEGLKVERSAKDFTVSQVVTEAKGLSEIEKLVDKYLIDHIINSVLVNKTSKISVRADLKGLNFKLTSK